jgi:hypothetical protein
MESKIDQLLLIVEKLCKQVRAPESKITDLQKYVSDAMDESITIQEKGH